MGDRCDKWDMPVHLSHSGPLVEAITEALARKAARPFLVAIDGRGGAGKSSLAAAMARELPRASVVHTDDFAFGWEVGWDWAPFREQRYSIRSWRGGPPGTSASTGPPCDLPTGMR